MKKHLFAFLFILLLTGSFFAQHKIHSGFKSAQPFAGTISNSRTSKLHAIVTTTTSTCMSVNLPAPATWSLANYGTGTPFAANGFVNGANTYGDKEKAMYFDVSASANTMLTQVYVGFGIAYSATPTKTVAIKIYDGTSGTPPATALATRTLAMSTIMQDVANNQYSLIMFPTPVNLPASKKFFVSVDVSGLQWTASVKDSLSIVSNTDPQSNPTPVWEKQSNNSWYNYSNALSWNLKISLLIHPFLTQAPITTSITASQNTICTGQSINYTSTGSTAGTYEWDFGAIPTPTAGGPSASPVYPTAGTYTTFLIVEDACGSLGIAQKTVQVNQTPVVTASPSSTSICQGGSVVLAGAGAATYAWSGGISNNTAFNPSASGNYTVTGTAANQCTAAAVASVIVNPNPTVTANATSTLVCSGSSVTLNGSGANSYSWSGGVTNGTGFAPSASGSYTVTGTSAANCTGTATIALTVAANPTVSASASSASVCAGNTVALNGSGASTYSWSGGVSDGVAFNPSNSGTYTVTGTSTANCSGTATIALTVAPNPTIAVNISSPTICVGGSVTLIASGAASYSWTAGVVNGVAFSPANTATYIVTGYDANGCEGATSAVVVVDPCTGLEKQTPFNRVSVYPNPSTNDLTISLDYVTNGLQLEIYDTLGTVIYSQPVSEKKIFVTASLASGIYILKLNENGKTISTQKIVRK